MQFMRKILGRRQRAPLSERDFDASFSELLEQLYTEEGRNAAIVHAVQENRTDNPDYLQAASRYYEAIGEYDTAANLDERVGDSERANELREKGEEIARQQIKLMLKRPISYILSLGASSIGGAFESIEARDKAKEAEKDRDYRSAAENWQKATAYPLANVTALTMAKKTRDSEFASRVYENGIRHYEGRGEFTLAAILAAEAGDHNRYRMYTELANLLSQGLLPGTTVQKYADRAAGLYRRHEMPKGIEPPKLGPPNK